MPYEEIFCAVAQEFGLDWRLLIEIGWRESRLDPLAIGKAGDMGIMQIIPATWNEWAPKVNAVDPFDPESNIRVAASLLAWLHKQLSTLGRPEIYWTLTAYNWGIGNVTRLLKAGGVWSQVPKERQDYAVDITLATEARIIAEPSGEVNCGR